MYKLVPSIKLIEFAESSLRKQVNVIVLFRTYHTQDGVKHNYCEVAELVCLL